MNNLTQQLQQMPQVEIPENIFSNIEKSLKNRNFLMRHRIISTLSLLAVMIMATLFVLQQKSMDEKDSLIQELVNRTMQLEQILAAETPTYSRPGSLITERIVNMESYLTKLEDDIEQTKDNITKSRLMATKLDLLAEMVLLQRKINQNPNYQKVKPYII